MVATITNGEDDIVLSLNSFNNYRFILMEFVHTAAGIPAVFSSHYCPVARFKNEYPFGLTVYYLSDTNVYGSLRRRVSDLLLLQNSLTTVDRVNVIGVK